MPIQSQRDSAAHKVNQARMNNGFRLFGKYITLPVAARAARRPSPSRALNRNRPRRPCVWPAEFARSSQASGWCSIWISSARASDRIMEAW